MAVYNQNMPSYARAAQAQAQANAQKKQQQTTQATTAKPQLSFTNPAISNSLANQLNQKQQAVQNTVNNLVTTSKAPYSQPAQQQAQQQAAQAATYTPSLAPSYSAPAQPSQNATNAVSNVMSNYYAQQAAAQAAAQAKAQQVINNAKVGLANTMNTSKASIAQQLAATAAPKSPDALKQATINSLATSNNTKPKPVLYDHNKALSDLIKNKGKLNLNTASKAKTKSSNKSDDEDRITGNVRGGVNFSIPAPTYPVESSEIVPNRGALTQLNGLNGKTKYSTGEGTTSTAKGALTPLGGLKTNAEKEARARAMAAGANPWGQTSDIWKSLAANDPFDRPKPDDITPPPTDITPTDLGAGGGSGTLGAAMALQGLPVGFLGLDYVLNSINDLKDSTWGAHDFSGMLDTYLNGLRPLTDSAKANLKDWAGNLISSMGINDRNSYIDALQKAALSGYTSNDYLGTVGANAVQGLMDANDNMRQSNDSLMSNLIDKYHDINKYLLNAPNEIRDTENHYIDAYSNIGGNLLYGYDQALVNAEATKYAAQLESSASKYAADKGYASALAQAGSSSDKLGEYSQLYANYINATDPNEKAYWQAIMQDQMGYEEPAGQYTLDDVMPQRRADADALLQVAQKNGYTGQQAINLVVNYLNGLSTPHYTVGSVDTYQGGIADNFDKYIRWQQTSANNKANSGKS